MICSICLLSCSDQVGCKEPCGGDARDQQVEQCLQCESRFHSACMSKWIRSGRGCPNCRFCLSLVLLRQFLPDIPCETTDSLTTLQRDFLCRMAVFLILLKAAADDASTTSSMASSRTSSSASLQSVDSYMDPSEQECQ